MEWITTVLVRADRRTTTVGRKFFPYGIKGKELAAEIKAMIHTKADTIRRYGRPSKNFTWGSSMYSSGPKGLNVRLATSALRRARGLEEGTKMKVTKRQLRNIIREEYYSKLPKDHIDGQPWSGTPEDLATAQASTWGNGAVVDPKGYKNLVQKAIDFTKGKSNSPLNEEWAQPATSPDQTDADSLLDKFYIEVDALASSVGFIPLSRESISDRYTLEDYMTDLSHQLRGQRK